ncbi:hypothetical protein BRSU_2603 [Brachyspira suanatina]|uniref:Uncharacterized protein n=1 Tax=Brachyspira suanatina TaxID=381802 RepID=A0A0G4KAM4_9SPIR|nr:hypothetical protein [Brachyspira suanatina]CRF35359.1 hypothetical protein BRSU_2603 [Brachyspira suanatina]
MFRVIKEPTENPSNLLDSYRQQNIIMQKMRMLHTAFDGIKLNHWSDTDRELPDILAGSICEFEGRLLETNQTIKLTDNISSGGTIKQDLRFIKLVIVRDSNNKDNDYLRAEIAGGYSETVGNGFPTYDYENRGFYNLDSNGKAIEKYLRISMKYDSNLGGYVEKKYWNINDINRKGQTLKRKTVNFGVGTHEFNFPSDVNSITVHITSGGGGGCVYSSEGASGGNSQILINDKVITTCGAGGGGKSGNIDGKLGERAGSGGVATGSGKLIQGVQGEALNRLSTNRIAKGGKLNNITLASGGNGGDGGVVTGAYTGTAGGGSGSAAIVDITRSMLGTSQKIKLVIGGGGAAGVTAGYKDSKNGENGSAVIEYMQK